MAGVLEEFDEATPLKSTYCSRLSAEEYEEQGSACTERALAELLGHLDENPEVYKDILSKKKKQDQENAGFLSYVKVKLFSLLSGEESTHISDNECKQHLDKLKTDMVKAFDYSQDSKGQRFSKRLAEKRLRSQQQYTPNENIPPPPLPPPPPPCATPLVRATLTRRPLTEHKVRRNDRKKNLTASADSKPHQGMIQQLKGSECRRRLRKSSNKSPGGTPLSGRPKRRYDPELLPYFNSKLVEKFKSTQHSPSLQSPTLAMASPGSFESPLHSSQPQTPI